MACRVQVVGFVRSGGATEVDVATGFLYHLAMPPTFDFPVWTPRTFPDGSLRWIVDEPVALDCVLRLGQMPHVERFDFARRREVHRTVTFPTFTYSANDLFFRVPWEAPRRRTEVEFYVVLENESKPAALARLRLFCVTGGVWQDDWATWERQPKRRVCVSIVGN